MTARAMERSVLPLFESGAITVPIAETFPLERAPEAYDRFTARGQVRQDRARDVHVTSVTLR